MKGLFTLLEKNQVVLSEDVKNTITEAFNIAVKEKSDPIETSKKEVEKKVADLTSVLKEAKSEIVALRDKKVKLVNEEVKKFEEKMVNKLDSYLEHKFKDLVPQTLVESVAKLEVYEPLVEAIKNTFETKGIKIDDKGFSILKEAKSEIVETRKKYDKLMEEKIALESASEKLLGKYLLNEKCDGLTEAQEKKVKSLLEDASYEDIEKRFNIVRDLVISEGTESKKTEKKAAKVINDVPAKDDTLAEDKKDEYGSRHIL